MKKKMFHFHIVFHPEPEGGFTAIVPSLPGCVSYGKTLQETKAAIHDAIQGYIKSLIKHHEPVPSDADNFVATIDIDVMRLPARYPAYR